MSTTGTVHRRRTAGDRTHRSDLFARVLALGLIVCLALPTAAQVLDQQIAALLVRHDLLPTAKRHITVGVSVIDITTGEVLAAHEAKTPLIPASNMKLLTTGSALRVLGPGFAFRTRVYLDGDRLVVQGDGDPALGDPVVLEDLNPPLTIDQFFSRIVDAVKDSGRTSISQIVIDDRAFDRQFIHPAWPRDQLQYRYSAEVSGLNIHTNVLWVYPEADGGRVAYSISPRAPWVPFDVQARLADRGTNMVSLNRAPQANRFTLAGRVTSSALDPLSVTIHNPPLFFGRLLARRLAEAGVPVLGTEDPPGFHPDPPGAPLGVRLARADERFNTDRVLALVTTPIDRIVARCNTDSQNLYAESLLKRLGREISGEPGSWSNGAAVIRMNITETIGSDAVAQTIVSDGSGMSRKNRVTPKVLARWLAGMQDDPDVGDLFVHSLATPGTGTLRKRFRAARPANNLRAKSGYLNGVVCLSGYVTDPSTGHRVAFASLANGVPRSFNAAAKRFHEDLVLLIDRWLGAHAPARAIQPGG